MTAAVSWEDYGDFLPPEAIEAATSLACAVRDFDSRTVAEILTRPDLAAIAVALAAMVDVSKPVRTLLRWTERCSPPVPLTVVEQRRADLVRSLTHFDEVAIERRMRGDKTVRLTKNERAEIARRWKQSGRGSADLERTTGIKSTRYTVAV